MKYITLCSMSFCLMLLSSGSDGEEPFEPTKLRDFGKLSFLEFNFGAELIGQDQSNCVQVVVLRSGGGERGRKGLPPSCEKEFRRSASSRGSGNQSRHSCWCDSRDA